MIDMIQRSFKNFTILNQDSNCVVFVDNNTGNKYVCFERSERKAYEIRLRGKNLLRDYN